MAKGENHEHPACWDLPTARHPAEGHCCRTGAHQQHPEHGTELPAPGVPPCVAMGTEQGRTQRCIIPYCTGPHFPLLTAPTNASSGNGKGFVQSIPAPSCSTVRRCRLCSPGPAGAGGLAASCREPADLENPLQPLMLLDIHQAWRSYFNYKT